MPQHVRTLRKSHVELLEWSASGRSPFAIPSGSTVESKHFWGRGVFDDKFLSAYEVRTAGQRVHAALIDGREVRDLLPSPQPLPPQDIDYTLPAVSGINGKWQLDGRWLNARKTW